MVVGAGKMGLAHLKVLRALQPGALACWAPSGRARDAVAAADATFFSGSLGDALRSFEPSHVVIASPVETLTPVALEILSCGVTHVLIEKPAALTLRDAQRLAQAEVASSASIRIAYNRRFYSSVRTALARIRRQSEPILSVLFEFNESFPNPSGPVTHAECVRHRWVVANSLHVIDTALFPVGMPDPKRSYFLQSGRTMWHPSGGVFIGGGETVSGVPFTYHANWSGPGGWGIEWVTPSARYVLRPLETLAIMRPGCRDREDIPLEDDLDDRFKPGVYLQDRAFLDGSTDLVSARISDAMSLIALGNAIGGYSEC
jgi:predicted dehydrogenase